MMAAALAVSALAQSLAPGGAPAGTADETVQLPPLSVNAQSSGYSVTTATGATRTNTPLIDIPQTVDIVTSQMWQDQDAVRWDQAFAYMANVEVRNRYAGFGDGVGIRGFQNFSNSTAEDGILVGDQPYKRDMIGYDQLQIVKGPPSAVQGRASGTGYFNWVLKKPELTGDFTDASFLWTTDEDGYGGGRLTLDTNQVLNSSGTMAIRIAGADQSTDEYIKFMHTNMTDLFPSFRWKINDSTELVLTDEIYKDNTPSREEGHGFADYPYKDRILFPMFDTPTDPITALHLPMDFNLAGPGANEYEEVYYSTLFLTHQFNDHFSYRQAVNWGTSSIDSQAYTDENNSTTLIAYGYIHSILERHSWTVQGDFFAKYNWNIVSSNTLIGYNLRNESDTISAWKENPTGPFITNNDINIVQVAAAGDSPAFYSGRSVPNGPPATYTYAPAGNFGVYVEQDLGLLNNLILLNGSIRRDHDHTYTFNYVNNTQASNSDTQLTSYRYGVTLRPETWLALYAVESEQSNPAATYQRYNGLLPGDPRLGQFFSVYPTEKLYEYGLKSELFDGRLSFTADHWELLATGSVVNGLQTGTSEGQNVTYGTETVLQGSESHGFEFESFGSITDRLSVVANYTRMFTSVQNSKDPLNPNDLIALEFDPIWSVNLYAKYDFHAPNQNGFDLRGGIRAIGPYWGQVTLSSGAVQVYVPHSQYTIDFGGGYVWGHYDFDVYVQNWNDSAFLLTRDIPPRTYNFSATARF